MIVAQQLLNGLITGSVYALFALGFTLVFGVLGVLNLAHGAVFTWGAFIALYAVTKLRLGLVPAILAAMVLGGILSVLVDWVAFRPLRRRGAPEFSAIVSSIGLSMILTTAAMRVSDTRVLRFPFGSAPAGGVLIGPLRATTLQLLVCGAVFAVVLALVLLIYRTSLGAQIRAVAVSAKTASLMGINPALVYAQTFLISGALAALAGVLIGLSFNSVHFLMGEPFMLTGFVVIVLGGLGSVTGAVVGGLLLGIVQTVTVAFVTSELSDAVMFTVLFAVLLLQPQGFFGSVNVPARVGRR